MTAIKPFTYNKLFGEIPVEEEPGHTKWQYVVKREHFNPAGSLHGGVLSTLLDTAMGHAVRTVRPPNVVHSAIHLYIMFVGPTLDEGGTVTIEGRVIKMGKRIAYAEGVAIDQTGRELARGSSTYALLAK